MKYHLPNIELKIKLQMDGLKKRLSRWREVTAREFPDRPDLLDMIPAPDGISIKKLNKGTINTDTCNAAQKDRRLLVQEAGDDITIYQQDCMHHLRCVWINGVSKAINVFMRAFLNDSLEEISSFLRVSPDLMHVIIAYHKEFSLTANYPKRVTESNSLRGSESIILTSSCSTPNVPMATDKISFAWEPTQSS